MSLIEDALRKAKKSAVAGPAEEAAPSPDPQNLLFTGRSRSSTPSPLFWVSVLSLTALVSVALWMVFSLPSDPVPSVSRMVHTKSIPTAPPASSERVPSLGADSAPWSTPAPESAPVEQSAETPQIAAAKGPQSQRDGAAASPDEEPIGPAPRGEENRLAEHDQRDTLERWPEEKGSPPTRAHTSLPAGGNPGSSGQTALVESLLQRAFIYSQAGDTAQALECYDRILLLHPSHFEARLNRGILRTRIGATAGAKEDLLAAQHANPADPWVLNALGVLYLKTGEQDRAEESFRNAGDATALINLALAYWEKGEGAMVIRTLEEAERADPQNPYAAYYLGLYYRGKGEHALALEKLNQACAVARRKGLTDLAETIESLRLGR